MLDELKSRVLLESVRGKLPVDRETLVRAMSAVTCFGAAAGDRLKELDFNPVLSGPEGVSAVRLAARVEISVIISRNARAGTTNMSLT